MVSLAGPLGPMEHQPLDLLICEGRGGEGGRGQLQASLSLSLSRANNNYEAVAVIELEQLKCTTLSARAQLWGEA